MVFSTIYNCILCTWSIIYFSFIISPMDRSYCQLCCYRYLYFTHTHTYIYTYVFKVHAMYLSGWVVGDESGQPGAMTVVLKLTHLHTRAQHSSMILLLPVDTCVSTRRSRYHGYRRWGFNSWQHGIHASLWKKHVPWMFRVLYPIYIYQPRDSIVK